MVPWVARLGIFSAVPLLAEAVGLLAVNASCDDAACCMANAQVDSDRQICKDFYDHKIGIGYQMLKSSGWEYFATSWSGWKRIWHDEPPTSRIHEQQCVSISHSGKMSCPYPGAGGWGIAFNVGPSSNFWKFSQVCKHGELSAQCHDGYKCGPTSRSPIVTTDQTYDEWESQKNAVVAQTGTSQCKLSHYSAYNEFDTNGLPTHALAGVFIPDCLRRRGEPQMDHVCTAMKRINPGRKESWPVFAYSHTHTSSSLRLDHYLNCEATLLV